MAQFKVGDKVRVKTKTEAPFAGNMNEGTGIVVQVEDGIYPYQIQVEEAGRLLWFKESEVFPLDVTAAVSPSTLTITATLTTDTIPMELIKQLSAAGFLITIKGI